MAKEMEAESTTPDPVVPAGDIKGVGTLASTSTTPDPVAPAGATRDAGTLDPPPPYLAAITQMDTTKVVTTQPSMTPLDPAQLGAAKPVPVYVYAEQPPEKGKAHGSGGRQSSGARCDGLERATLFKLYTSRCLIFKHFASVQLAKHLAQRGIPMLLHVKPRPSVYFYASQNV
ncbi:Obscurin [Frankliniella fusca]|uniref:Obscurin n=1 Tax=Frankliniella fusca TaxID=407009 RepID=A0AAE1HY79_9NEOP|nr:Obscurin [Frankliniella fusca]